MRAALPLFTASLFLLGGCDGLRSQVVNVAENTRTATEQLAFQSEQRNQLREIEIDPHAGDLRRPLSSLLVERFETREGPDGFFVYDTETHSIARIGGDEQTGLTYDQAQTAFDALATADAKGALP